MIMDDRRVRNSWCIAWCVLVGPQTLHLLVLNCHSNLIVDVMNAL